MRAPQVGGVFPWAVNEIIENEDGHVIHHQGHDNFVGVHAIAKYGGYESPETARRAGKEGATGDGEHRTGCALLRASGRQLDSIATGNSREIIRFLRSILTLFPTLSTILSKK